MGSDPSCVPTLKLLLDYFWAPLFLGAYAYGGIYLATEVLIASTLAMVALWWLWKREWNKTYLVLALVTAVLGGTTLYLRDPAFIKLKPTVVYGVFAAALLGSHFVGKQVLLARLPQKTLSLPDPVWRKVNFAWGLYFVGCAALNWYVASHFDEATWVKVKVFGFTSLTFVFAMAHIPFLWRYLPQE